MDRPVEQSRPRSKDRPHRRIRWKGCDDAIDLIGSGGNLGDGRRSVRERECLPRGRQTVIEQIRKGDRVKFLSFSELYW